MKVALFLISALVLAATQAHANEQAKKYYLKVEAGGSFPTELTDFEFYENNRPKNGAVFGFGAGYNINRYLSADASFNHFPYHKFDKTLNSGGRRIQTIRSSSLMFNMIFNVPTPYYINPFFNAGAGFAHNNAGDYVQPMLGGYDPGKVKDSFAWNVGAGGSFKINEWFSPYITYKYFDLGKIQSQPYFVDLAETNPLIPNLKAAPAIKSRLRTHTTMLGLMYNF